MHLADFERHLRAFAQTKAWALCEREEPTTRDELVEYERQVGYALPGEYMHVVLTMGAGQLGFTEVFSVRPGEWSIDSQRTTAPGLPEDFVPISGNGCGDFYGFKVVAGKCLAQIMFAEHEENYALKATEFTDFYEYLVRNGLNAV